MQASFIILSENHVNEIVSMVEAIQKLGVAESEIIIVDDASLDGTVKVLFEKIGSKVKKIIYNDRKIGPILSLAAGAQSARYENLILIKDTQILSLADYEKMVAPITKDEADLVYIKDDIFETDWQNRFLNFWANFWLNISGVMVNASHKAFKRKCLSKIYKSGSKFGADAELLAYLQKQKFHLKMIKINHKTFSQPQTFYDFLMSLYAIVRYKLF